MKNYTSLVPVGRTIGRIEEILARAGALSIHKEYVDGRISALSFTLSAEQAKAGADIAVRLPVEEGAVYSVLMADKKKPQAGTAERIREQAGRTAWKLMQDWIEIQISMIEMRQAEILQVFMPYIWAGGKTLYRALVDGGFKMLTEGKAAK